MMAGGTARRRIRRAAERLVLRRDRQPSMPFAVLLEVALASRAAGWRPTSARPCTSDDRSALPQSRRHGDRIRGSRPRRRHADNQRHDDQSVAIGRHDHPALRFRGDVRRRPAGLSRQHVLRLLLRRMHWPQQVGIREAKPYEPTAAELARGEHSSIRRSPRFPTTMLRMIDNVDLFVPDGGPHGLGLIRGSKAVDPAEWFFKAHFYQDPVWPGSLGLESFLQLLKLLRGPCAGESVLRPAGRSSPAAPNTAGSTAARSFPAIVAWRFRRRSLESTTDSPHRPRRRLLCSWMGGSSIG